jgi:hypothetical protein
LPTFHNRSDTRDLASPARALFRVFEQTASAKFCGGSVCQTAAAGAVAPHRRR